MADIQIFKNDQFGEIRTVEKEFAHIKSCGWVYALEFGDMIKIGCTHSPYKRLINLSHIGGDYSNLQIGRFVLSKPCVNYKSLEKELHKLFSEYRKNGTELFGISLERVISALNCLEYDTDFAKADADLEE